MSDFKFCPRDATPLVEGDAGGMKRLLCPKEGCGFVHWGNPLPVVAAIVQIGEEVVLVRNPGWPAKFFGLVTGFLEAGETPEAGVLREVKEELSLDAEVVSLVGVYAFEIRNEVLICYHVRATGEPEITEELEAFKKVPIDKLRAWDMGTGLALKDWLARRRQSTAEHEGLSSDQQRREAEEQRRSGARIAEALIKTGEFEDSKITDRLSKKYGVPAINLKDFEIDSAVLEKVPKDVALKHLVIPVNVAGPSLIVAMCDPSNTVAIDDLLFLTGHTRIEPVVATEASIRAAIDRYYGKTFGN